MPIQLDAIDMVISKQGFFSAVCLFVVPPTKRYRVQPDMDDSFSISTHAHAVNMVHLCRLVANCTPAIFKAEIPHWLAEEFRTYCSKLYGLTPDDRVFYMTCTALNKELARCTKITYLPDIRVHDLRHSHVSLCIELGYSIVLVAKRIGDTVPVVMRTYAHLYPNKQQELVSRLETLSTSSSSKDESDLMPLV